MRKIGQMLSFLIPVIALVTLVVFMTGAGRRKRAEAEIKELLGDMFKAMDNGDVEKMLSFFSEDATFNFPGQPPAKGKEAIKGFFAGLGQQFKGLKHRLDKFIIKGDNVALEGMIKFTFPDGREVDSPFVDIFEMRAGKIHQYRVYLDTAALAK